MRETVLQMYYQLRICASDKDRFMFILIFLKIMMPLLPLLGWIKLVCRFSKISAIPKVFNNAYNGKMKFVDANFPLQIWFAETLNNNDAVVIVLGNSLHFLSETIKGNQFAFFNTKKTQHQQRREKSHKSVRSLQFFALLVRVYIYSQNFLAGEI